MVSTSNRSCSLARHLTLPGMDRGAGVKDGTALWLTFERTSSQTPAQRPCSVRSAERPTARYRWSAAYERAVIELAGENVEGDGCHGAGVSPGVAAQQLVGVGQAGPQPNGQHPFGLFDAHTGLQRVL